MATFTPPAPVITANRTSQDSVRLGIAKALDGRVSLVEFEEDRGTSGQRWWPIKVLFAPVPASFDVKLAGAVRFRARAKANNVYSAYSTVVSVSASTASGDFLGVPAAPNVDARRVGQQEVLLVLDDEPGLLWGLEWQKRAPNGTWGPAASDTAPIAPQAKLYDTGELVLRARIKATTYGAWSDWSRSITVPAYSVGAPSLGDARRVNATTYAVQITADDSTYTTLYRRNTPTSSWVKEGEYRTGQGGTTVTLATLTPEAIPELRAQSTNTLRTVTGPYSSVVKVGALELPTPVIEEARRTTPTTAAVVVTLSGEKPDSLDWETRAEGAGWQNFGTYPHVEVRSITGLQAAKPYELRVRARRGTVVSAWTDVSVPVFDAGAVELLEAVRVSATKARVVVQLPANATGMQVEARVVGLPWAHLTTINARDHAMAFDVSKVAGPTGPVQLRVRGMVSGGYTAWSASVTADAWSSTPEAPGELWGQGTGPESGELRWNASGAGRGTGAEWANIVIERSDAGRPFAVDKTIAAFTGSTPVTSVAVRTDPTLDTAWRVYATNAAGQRSSASAPVTITAYYSAPEAPAEVVAEEPRLNPDGTATSTIRWSTDKIGSGGRQWVKIVIEGRTPGQLFKPVISIPIDPADRQGEVVLDRDPAIPWVYRLVAYNAAGQASTPSQELQVAAVLFVPARPSAPTATWYVKNVRVQWEYDGADPATAPTGFEVWRVTPGTQLRSLVASVPGAARYYDDQPPGDGNFAYEIVAVNAAGASLPSQPSGSVATSPTSPIELLATWDDGLSVITLSWPLDSTSASSWDIEHTSSSQKQSAPDAQWFPLTSGTLPGTARSWQHQSPAPGTPHTYRIRPTVPGAPTSAWTYSNALEADAGGGTSLPAPQVRFGDSMDVNKDVRVYVANELFVIKRSYDDNEPRPVLQYQVAHPDGHFSDLFDGSWGTWSSSWDSVVDPWNYNFRDEFGNAYFTIGYTLTQLGFVNGQQIKVRVRQLDPGYVPATTWRVLEGTLRNSPELTLLEPTATGDLPVGELGLRWRASRQDRWRAELRTDAGDLVKVVEGNGSGNTATLDGLVDGVSYFATVTVWWRGQRSDTARTGFIRAVWPDVPTPLVTATPEPNRGTILVTGMAYGGSEPDEVWRSYDGQNWEPVGTLGQDGTLRDRPRMAAPVQYRLRDHGPLGTWVDSEPTAPVTLGGCDVRITWDGGRRELVGGWNAQVQASASRQSVTTRYAGWDSDSTAWGPRGPRTISGTATIADGEGSPLSEWLAAAEHPGLVTYRDPTGELLTGVLASVQVAYEDYDEAVVNFAVSEAV